YFDVRAPLVRKSRRVFEAHEGNAAHSAECSVAEVKEPVMVSERADARPEVSRNGERDAADFDLRKEPWTKPWNRILRRKACRSDSRRNAPIRMNHPQPAQHRLRHDITAIRQNFDVFGEEKRQAREAHRARHLRLETLTEEVSRVAVIVNNRNRRCGRAWKSP